METPQKSDWHRLARYVSKEYTPAEKEAQEAWIVENEARARLADELKRVWKLTGLPLEWHDPEAAWRELSEKIDQLPDSALEPAEAQHREASPPGEAASPSEDGASQKRSKCRERGGARRRKAFRWQPLAGLAFAAVITVSGAAFALFQTGWLGAPPDSGGQTFVARAGERATVELPDGTQVKLNVESTLTVPQAFSDVRRRVHLEGEAYFDVAKDSTRPFQIRTQTAHVEVKGTAFNVRAYLTEEETQVAVREGEVALRPESTLPGRRPRAGDSPLAGDTSRVVRLRARDLGAVAGKGAPLVRRGADLDAYLAWTEGRLVFDNTPFEEVARRLERWYDVKIDLRVSAKSVGRLNATFEREPVDAVLKTIVAVLGLRYQKVGRRITFFANQGKTPHALRHAPAPLRAPAVALLSADA